MLPPHVVGGMITSMDGDPTDRTTPDLFSTGAVNGGSSAPPTKSPAAEATTESEPQRHVLPKNLPNAIKHLSDGELDFLHAATLEEMKRRGRKPQGVGRLAKQINRQLDGWINVLNNEPLIQLLDQMNSGGEDRKGASLGHVKSALKSIDLGGRLYQSLVEHGVFKLGYKTQCTHCHRSSWYSLSTLAEQLVCPLCYKKLDAISAVDRDNKGDWWLKTAGPFSVGNHGDGSYCVLLGLEFFERDHSLQTTPVLSFTAKQASAGKELEADFGLMWQDTSFGETQDGVLFAECKSYNEFQKRDFDRMEALARAFPGAILAFCTLRKTLKSSEIDRLKRLTKKGMKYWKNERPINPVLILTGHELFDYVGAPHCWKHVTVPVWARQAYTILEVCNATQGIYLNLPHWQETWRVEFERKRQKKKRKVA